MRGHHGEERKKDISFYLSETQIKWHIFAIHRQNTNFNKVAIWSHLWINVSPYWSFLISSYLIFWALHPIQVQREGAGASPSLIWAWNTHSRGLWFEGWVSLLKNRKNPGSTTHFCLDSIVTVAQVLQVRGCVGLHRGEVVLQHVDHLCQLRVTPSKLPGITGWT